MEVTLVGRSDNACANTCMSDNSRSCFLVYSHTSPSFRRKRTPQLFYSNGSSCYFRGTVIFSYDISMDNLCKLLLNCALQFSIKYSLLSRRSITHVAIFLSLCRTVRFSLAKKFCGKTHLLILCVM